MRRLSIAAIFVLAVVDGCVFFGGGDTTSSCAGGERDAFGPSSPAGPYVEITLHRNRGATRYLPSFAIWASEPGVEGGRTIYATCKAAHDRWGGAQRPDALPVWRDIFRREHAPPTESRIDAITTATPTPDRFTIRWEVPPEFFRKIVDLSLEANASFDYNAAYTAENAGVNGQPSLVWRASFRADDSDQPRVAVTLAGHGHVAGADGTIQPDLSAITTARDMFLAIDVAYRPVGSAPTPRPRRALR